MTERRRYLLAVIDATTHQHFHDHPTPCQAAAQIVPVRTKDIFYHRHLRVGLWFRALKTPRMSAMTGAWTLLSAFVNSCGVASNNLIELRTVKPLVLECFGGYAAGSLNADKSVHAPVSEANLWSRFQVVVGLA